jgi:hypothetical protein
MSDISQQQLTESKVIITDTMTMSEFTAARAQWLKEQKDPRTCSKAKDYEREYKALMGIEQDVLDGPLEDAADLFRMVNMTCATRSKLHEMHRQGNPWATEKLDLEPYTAAKRQQMAARAAEMKDADDKQVLAALFADDQRYNFRRVRLQRTVLKVRQTIVKRQNLSRKTWIKVRRMRTRTKAA